MGNPPLVAQPLSMQMQSRGGGLWTKKPETKPLWLQFQVLPCQNGDDAGGGGRGGGSMSHLMWAVGSQRTFCVHKRT